MRHEALRTIFPVVRGQPMQVVMAVTPFALPVVDLRSAPSNGDPVGLAQAMIASESHHVFN